MRYLKHFENLMLSPSYTFSMNDIIEYYEDKSYTKLELTKTNYSTINVINFLRKTIIGKHVKLKFITPKVLVKTVYYNYNSAWEFRIKGISSLDGNKIKISPYLHKSSIVQIFDEIPEESKKILEDVERRNTQKRFDL